MKCLVRVLGLIGWLAAASLQAQGPEDQYVRVYSLIQEADALNDAGQARLAMGKYLEARAALSTFPTAFPGWNENVIRFRMNYINGKLTPLLALAPGTTNQVSAPQPPTPPAPTIPTAPATNAPNIAPPAPAVPPVAPASQTNALIRELQEEMRRMQNDNADLTAKLKEALAARPPAADPSELAKAMDKNRSLQKENDLLKVTLGQEQARVTNAVAPDVLSEANRALTETKAKLAQQERTLETLQAENAILKKQSAAPAGKNSAEIQKLTEQLKQSRDSAASLQTQYDKLRTEKSTLSQRVADLETQLANASTASTETAKPDSKKVKHLQEELDKQKAAAKAAAKENEMLIAQLEKDKKQLARENAQITKEKAELEMKLASNASDTVKAEYKKRKQLESDVEDLRAKLAKTEKQNSRRADSKAIPADVLKDMEILKARVQVLEAKPSPYSAQELAVLSKPQAQLVVALSGSDPAAGTPTPPAVENKPAPARKAAKEPPPGTGAQAAAAQRAFAERRLDEAEQKFAEILRQDEKNVYILGNLAAVEIEKNKLDDAEKHLGTALAVDGQDDFCLYLMGRVKSLRGKPDEALNYLSQAAKLNPDSPQTQNYLGIVLSEKGLRTQAEAAFRKALQMQPDYAAAHNNLAFVYATQKPPLLALARWHYQKALDAGHPRNADLEKLIEEKP